MASFRFGSKQTRLRSAAHELVSAYAGDSALDCDWLYLLDASTELKATRNPR